MTARKGRILVIRGGAIGDFLLTLPVLTALRQQFPDVHLELLGYPHIAHLALAGGLVDGLRSIEARPLAAFFARGGALDAGLAGYFSGFGLIVSYLYDPDGVFKENVGRCSKAQFLSGPHRPPEEGTQHATRLFLQPLERLAIFDPDPVPRLQLPEGPSLPEGRWLAVHPGSGSEKKNWPEEKWAELLDLLASQTDLKLLLVGGEVEGDRLGRLQVRCPPKRVQLAQSLPLTELAGLLLQCRAFVGHDSGISHLGAALGLKGLVLWGPSNFDVWRPLSPQIRFLRSESSLQELDVAKVYESLAELLD